MVQTTLKKKILITGVGLLPMFSAVAAPSSVFPGDGTGMGENVALLDTLRNYDIEEAVIVASPKETSRFRSQPISVSVLGEDALHLTGTESVKGLSAFVPNVFMPAYGSRLTSAVYIRGIGSRINTPAVGLYVDNVPYVDKSAYDFSFIDVERVDVLRGPQATLYGRNAMGGLIRVSTADPFTHTGTDVSLEATGRTSGRGVKAVTYVHPSDVVAFSVGGFYNGENGFFRNVGTGEKADGSNAGGGKVRLAWRPSSNLRLDFTGSYEYSDEDACPYFLTKAGSTLFPDDDASTESRLVGSISQNRQSRYRRELINAGLGLEWQARNFVLSSISSFQHLNDRLFMDQDFVSSDIFTLEQKQRMSTYSEELSLKSLPGKRWQWVTGGFFMYQDMTTTCPVTFYSDGVEYLNRQFATVLPQRPAMSLTFTVPELPFNARLRTPALNAALFHQSTVNLGAGLSVVAGLRLDYDHTQLDLTSGSDADLTYNFSMPSFRINADLEANPAINGNLKDDTWQLLPKLALQYDHASGRGNVYVAVSKGYRSGGYNIQNYSDLSETKLRRSMMQGVREYSINTIKDMPLPEASKEAAIAGLTGVLDPNIPDEPEVSTLAYKPEQSWNFELGGHLKFFGNALHLNYTFFYMRTKDQQLARFSESGLGRVMVNAGRTRSCGAEVSFRTALLSDRLSLSASYGYTDATFTDYDLGKDDEGNSVDYSGHHVPFAPAHTLGVTAAFRQPFSTRVLKAVGVSADVAGAGRIYWDEANTYSQPFYAALEAMLTVELVGDVAIDLWGRNLTATRWTAFSFESMGNRFAQYGDPRCFGATARFHF